MVILERPEARERRPTLDPASTPGVGRTSPLWLQGSRAQLENRKFTELKRQRTGVGMTRWLEFMKQDTREGTAV